MEENKIIPKRARLEKSITTIKVPDSINNKNLIEKEKDNIDNKSTH